MTQTPITPASSPEEDDAALRDKLGELVRIVWIEWALKQPNPKPSWLVPWANLNETQKDVDRQIGEELFREGIRASLTFGRHLIQENADLRAQLSVHTQRSTP